MTWKVVLGTSNTQGPRSMQPQPLARDSKPGSQVRVLVVDDEPSLCKAYTMALSNAGYSTIAADSGESALAIIRSEPIDIMVVDLRMPFMRGDVVFAIATGFQPHLQYSTIFTTGDITNDAEKLIRGCGCHFLRKPFDLRDLLSGVAALAPRVQNAAG